MDNWILKGTKHLINEPVSEKIVSPTQVKVKISHLLLSDSDALLYSGKISTEYPRVLGRTAVGIITEVGEQCYGLEKNMRVYLHPVRPCGKCYNCRSGRKKECTDLKIAGRDFDGFMRDFAVCNYNEVSPLPDSVDDFHALCIETVGIADNICDRLDVTAGQRVAVVGADFLGNIIAQVLQYRKIIPILIDNNPENLEKARASGMSFAFENDDSLEEKIKDVTSGNKCDAVIYCANSKLPVSLSTRLSDRGKTVAFVGLSDITAGVDVREIIENDLTVIGVSHVYGYTDAIINILTHNAVDIDSFPKRVINEFSPVDLLEERCASFYTARKVDMTVLKMIF